MPVTLSETLVGVITDLHYTVDTHRQLAYHGQFDVPRVLDRLEMALAWFERAGAHAVLVTGDLTHDGDRASLDVVLEALDRHRSGPVFVLPGNHDQLQRDDALRDAVRGFGGRLRLLDAAGHDLGGLRIAAIDWTSADPVCATRETGEHTVLFSHYPVISRAASFAARGLAYPGDHPRTTEVLAALEAHASSAIVINGHLHVSESVKTTRLLQVTVGALVEQPFEAAIISIRRAQGSTRIERQAMYLDDPAGGAPVPSVCPLAELKANGRDVDLMLSDPGDTGPRRR